MPTGKGWGEGAAHPRFRQGRVTISAMASTAAAAGATDCSWLVDGTGGRAAASEAVSFCTETFAPGAGPTLGIAVCGCRMQNFRTKH